MEHLVTPTAVPFASFDNKFCFDSIAICSRTVEFKTPQLLDITASWPRASDSAAEITQVR